MFVVYGFVSGSGLGEAAKGDWGSGEIGWGVAVAFGMRRGLFGMCWGGGDNTEGQDTGGLVDIECGVSSFLLFFHDDRRIKLCGEGAINRRSCRVLALISAIDRQVYFEFILWPSEHFPRTIFAKPSTFTLR